MGVPNHFWEQNCKYPSRRLTLSLSLTLSVFMVLKDRCICKALTLLTLGKTLLTLH